MGGVVTGALAGLSGRRVGGGMTMGAGLVAGGGVGVLGAAGMAKGLNVVRGTDRSFATWTPTHWTPSPRVCCSATCSACTAWQPNPLRPRPLAAWPRNGRAGRHLWAGRERRLLNEGEADSLAQQLQPLLLAATKQALAADGRM